MISLLGKPSCPVFRKNVLGLDESHPQALKLAKWAESFIRKAALNDRSRGNGTAMVLSGPVGTGKTHVCRKVASTLNSWAVDLWVAKRWGPNIPAAKFSVWSRVVELERYSFDDWFDEARTAAWLILDDVGSEVDRYKTGEPTERLRRVLDLGRTGWLMLSTNVPKAKWADCFDVRVADRLSGCQCLDLTGLQSHRGNGVI